MKLINNKDLLLIDELRSTINKESNILISINHFTIFALYEILDILNIAKSIKVLINYQLLDEDDFRFIQNPKESYLNLKLDRPFKVNQVYKLLNEKIDIRQGSLGNQNMLLVENNNTSICYLITPLNIDTVSLGISTSDDNIFINSFEDSGNQYLGYFNQMWNNNPVSLNESINKLVLKAIRNYSGEEIYKYSIKEIFQYATINERADEKLKNIGFKDSKVWDMLYNFQKDAVIGAIEKIETFGGCIIADSVGLGKTFEALAVMKYYQLRNDRILVLAPKKLRENWTVYQLNDKRNILAADRLNYDVLNHTDLSRTKGKSGDIDLEMIHWGNYDLVVIDESHNFRNNPNKKEGITRYQRLMRDIIKANIKTKVLMLSATPVNNRMNDLKNQISFITEGEDDAFASYGIESIHHVMRDAQRKFTNWYKNGDPNNLSINQLMQHLDGSYFRILDMLTIARSRKHIEKYYDTKEIGKFPERLSPKTIYPKIDTENKFNDIGEIYDELSTLTLAGYSPLAYVRADKRAYYEQKYDVTTRTGSVFKQVDRDQSLIYLMRVNLLKRLESSIHSFSLTVQKLITFIENTLAQIDDYGDGVLDIDMNITDIDLDDTDLNDMLVGGKTKVLIQDIDIIKWRQDLKQDESVLYGLLANIVKIDAERDAKLQELKELIINKVENPINKENKKIIIFSAFADTANYLYKEIATWIKDEKGLYSALVTGGGSNKTNMPACKSDLSSVLTNFSPRSKSRKDIYPDVKDNIDILIGTDVISEGQNLQDCDYLINYDIHWNPVRIIQRFGRIDRIGSINDKIQLVNFFPSMELDQFIDLVAKVQGRMVMLDVSATGEDNIISKNSKDMQDLDYRRKQLKQLQEQVIDLEDIEGNISISDLTFNDFKVDLEKSSHQQLELLNQIPPASYAVVKSNLKEVKGGAIFCFKDKSETTSTIKSNLLHPFFLVYISADKSHFIKASQTKTALDYFRKLGMGNDHVLPDLITEFEKETKANKKMDNYVSLLKLAMDDILGVQEEIGWDSFVTPGETSLFGDDDHKKDDLELISYLIIK